MSIRTANIPGGAAYKSKKLACSGIIKSGPVEHAWKYSSSMAMDSVTELKIVMKMRWCKMVKRFAEKPQNILMNHIFRLRVFNEANIGVEGDTKG